MKTIQSNTGLSWEKLIFSLIIGASVILMPIQAWAGLPSTASTNVTTLNGAAPTFTTTGSTLTVAATSANTILSWQNFWDGTAAGGTSTSTDVINFSLPSATSAILNQADINNTLVGGGANVTYATIISGTISSNGKVYLLNPNGITIGATGVINAAGFYASTVAENIGYFQLNNNLQIFSGSPQNVAGVTGNITVTNGAVIQTVGGGGDIRLAANTVTEQGGSVFGNVYIVASATNLATATNFGVIATGPGNGGNLTVNDLGGTVSVSGAGNSTLVQGNAVITTTPLSPSTAGGAITEAGGLVITTPGSILTLNTSGTNGAAAGTITLSSVDAPDYMITGGNTSITDEYNNGFNNVALGTSSITGTLSVTSDFGSISNVSGQTTAVTGAISLSALAANQTITFAGSGTVNFGAVNGNATNGVATLSSTGNVIVSGPIGAIPTLTVSAGGTLTLSGTITGTPSVTLTSAGNMAINNSIVGPAGGFTKLAITSTGGSITSSLNGYIDAGTSGTGALVMTAAGNISLSDPVGGTTPFKTIALTSTGGYIGTWATTATTSETISAAGNVSLGPTTAPTLSVTSTGGYIGENTGPITSTTATFNAATGSTLTVVTNAIGTAILQGAGTTAITNGAALIIGTGTNENGATTVRAPSIAFGASSSDVVTFGGNLTATVAAGGSNISTAANALNVAGTVTLSTTATNGTIGFGTAAATGTYGTVNAAAGSGNITLTSLGSLNLGTVTTTGNLSATSLANSITNTGLALVTVGGTTTLSAGTVASPSTIQVGGAANVASLTGTITDANGSLTLWNSLPTTITTATNNVASASVWVTNDELTGSTALAFLTPTNGIAAISFNVTSGNVTVSSVGTPDESALTLSNLVNGATDGTDAVYVWDAGTVTLGSGIALAGNGTTGATVNGTLHVSPALSIVSTGSSAGIVDTPASPFTVNGPLVLTSAAGINVANNTANSVAGPVLLTQTGAGSSNIAYTQGNTINLGGIVVANLNSVESTTIQSVNGTIFQTGGIGLSNSTTTATFSAPNGQVLLNVFPQAAGNPPISAPLNYLGGTSSQLSITAMFPSAVVANSSLNFGNVSISNGSFYASTSQAAAAPITQITGTTFNVSGNTYFVTQGGKITVANTGNAFGNVSADPTNSGTLNNNVDLPTNFASLYTVGAGTATAAPTGAATALWTYGNGNYGYVNTGTATTSTLLLKSETGNITETGSTVVTGGATTLTATGGNITLTGASNNFGGQTILVTTGAGNAALTDTNAVTVVANRTIVGGNFTITNTNANGVIQDTGSPSSTTVGGNALFAVAKTGTGYVQFLGTNNSFGALALVTGSGTSTIYSNANLTLALSTVNGPITFNVFGNFATSGAIINPNGSGVGSTFASTVRVNANGSGNITIGTPVFITGQLTVNGNGTEDLSFLSKATNLSGLTPNNLGTGTYKAPQP